LTGSLHLFQSLAGTADEQRQQLVIRHLQQQLAHALGLDDASRIDPQEPLESLGVDSLLATQLAASITETFGEDEMLRHLSEGHTLAAISRRILEVIYPAD
jgi:hypothetical protein